MSRRDDLDPKMLPAVMDKLKANVNKGAVVLSTVNEQKIGLIVGVTKNFTQSIDAVELANHVATQVGGKGGGRPIWLVPVVAIQKNWMLLLPV